jgi:hypothetical protein
VPVRSDAWSFIATVIIVVGFLGTGVYLSANGHSEWYWLFVGLAVLAPDCSGMLSPRSKDRDEDIDIDA